MRRAVLGAVLALALPLAGPAVAAASPSRTSVPSCLGKPATIIGTAGNDVLNGTAGADVIVGLGGNDTIDGRGGNDLICGGPGNDALNGNAGRDGIDGGPGRDVCTTGEKLRSCEVHP